MALHTRPRRSRKWAPDTLAVREALFGDMCRVCGKVIVKGDSVHAFHWREELGRAHVACGFYSLTEDTYADREAIACARKLLELAGGAVVPTTLRDEAIRLSLVRRVHSAGSHEAQIKVTTIGYALLRLLKPAPQAAADVSTAASQSASYPTTATAASAAAPITRGRS